MALKTHTRKTERKRQLGDGDTNHEMHVLARGTVTQWHTSRNACAGCRSDVTKCTGHKQSVDFTTQHYSGWGQNMPHGVVVGVRDRWKVSKITMVSYIRFGYCQRWCWYNERTVNLGFKWSSCKCIQEFAFNNLQAVWYRAHLHLVGMFRFMSHLNQSSLPTPF